MSIISTVLLYIPFQAGPAFSPAPAESSQPEDYYCVPPEHETDRNAAFLEFAHRRCNIEQLNIEQVPISILDQFVPDRDGDHSPRRVRVNHLETIADFFDSHWLGSLGWLVRRIAGDDYCQGSELRINQAAICQELRDTLPEPPEPTPDCPPPVVVPRPCPAPTPCPTVPPVIPTPTSTPIRTPRPPQPTPTPTPIMDINV